MYSIQNQSRDTIYYKPNVKKLYVKAVAQEVMHELISENFWTNAAVFCMPEDK